MKKEIIKPDNTEIGQQMHDKSTINERVVFKLPSLNGDTQIYLGQSIVTLVRLAIENDRCYSIDMQHSFKVELLYSILEELNIPIDDLSKLKKSYKELNEEDN